MNSRVSKKKWCKWLLALPLVWLGWQLISATNTVDRELMGLTVRYFFGCVACFYLGYGCLSGGKLTWRFWLPILTAVGLVMAVGFEQHFGGLEDTHRYFYTYVYPHLKTVPPELVKKMNSSRIFSTLFYPNALAGVLLLLLPPLSVMLWRIGDRMTAAARGLLIGLLWVGGMGCLYWSGSKGGWLLQLILFVIALMHLSVPKRLKLTVVVAFMVVGLAGFAVKYARFFEKGATSVVARFDYWRAAAQTVASKPILGSGPGTFGPVYARIKNPDAEMARLVHNDYLEQASDSGIPGFLAYLGFVVGALWYGYPAPKSAENWLRFGVWLGLVGWALQGVSEFGLYIPALSWTAFSLMGWLVRTGGNRIDKTVPA